MGNPIAYVYILSTADVTKGPIKIGVSRNPAERVRAINTSSPHKMFVAHLIECATFEQALRIEAAFKDWGDRSKLHGEWFDYTPLVAVQILHSAIVNLYHVETEFIPDLYEAMQRA